MDNNLFIIEEYYAGDFLEYLFKKNAPFLNKYIIVLSVDSGNNLKTNGEYITQSIGRECVIQHNGMVFIDANKLIKENKVSFFLKCFTGYDSLIIFSEIPCLVFSDSEFSFVQNCDDDPSPIMIDEANGILNRTKWEMLIGDGAHLSLLINKESEFINAISEFISNIAKY